MNYRILKEESLNGAKRFLVQEKFLLFFWSTLSKGFATFKEAEEFQNSLVVKRSVVRRKESNEQTKTK